MPTHRQLDDTEFYLLNSALHLQTPDLNLLPRYYAEFRDVLMNAIRENPQCKLWVRDKGGNDRWAVMQNGDIYFGITDNLKDGIPVTVLRMLGQKLAPWEWERFIKNWIGLPVFFLASSIWFIVHPPSAIPILGKFDEFFLSQWTQGAIGFVSLATIARHMLKPLRYYRLQQELSRKLLEHVTRRTPEEVRADSERFAAQKPKF